MINEFKTMREYAEVQWLLRLRHGESAEVKRDDGPPACLLVWTSSLRT